MNFANPLATVLSSAKMFEDSFGLKEELKLLAVVNKSLNADYVTEDLAAKGVKANKTSEVGDWLVANL